MESMCQNYSTGDFTFSIDSKQGKGLFWNYPGYKGPVTQREEGNNQFYLQFLQQKQVSIVLGYSYLLSAPLWLTAKLYLRNTWLIFFSFILWYWPEGNFICLLPPEQHEDVLIFLLWEWNTFHYISQYVIPPSPTIRWTKKALCYKCLYQLLPIRVLGWNNIKDFFSLS